MKFLHFLDVGKVVTLLLQTKTSVLWIFSTTIATRIPFRTKKVLENSSNISGDITFLPRQCEGKKLIFLHSLDVGKVVTLLLQNQKICALEIFNYNSRLRLLSGKKKVLENSLNTSGDIAFLLGQCKGKNWNFYIFWMLENLSRCYFKPKHLCTGYFQPQKPPASPFSQKKVLENSLNTSGDIAFLLGQGKGKNWNFYISWMLEKL